MFEVSGRVTDAGDEARCIGFVAARKVSHLLPDFQLVEVIPNLSSDHRDDFVLPRARRLRRAREHLSRLELLASLLESPPSADDRLCSSPDEA